MQLTQRNLFLGYFFYMETDTTWYHLYFKKWYIKFFYVLFDIVLEKPFALFNYV